MCLGVICLLYFWQNDWGLKRVTAVTQDKSYHRKVTLEKKIPPLLLLNSNSQPFNHKSGTTPTSYPDMLLLSHNQLHFDFSDVAVTLGIYYNVTVIETGKKV